MNDVTDTLLIGDDLQVQTDGYVITIRQQDDGRPAQIVELEPHELFNLIDFADDQAKLREQRMAWLHAQATDTVSPQWRFDARYRCWAYRVGRAHIELAPRAAHCDRGRWVATVLGVGDVDWADGFPMYFQDLERAKLEMQAWLNARMREYKDSDAHRKLEVLNRLRDLRDAVVRIEQHVSEADLEALIAVYSVIQHKLAPAGVDRE